MEIIWFFFIFQLWQTCAQPCVYNNVYELWRIHTLWDGEASWLTYALLHCESVIRISQSTLSAIFNYVTRCYLATGCVCVQVPMILCMGICSCTCICIHTCVEDSFSVIPHCFTWFLRQGLWLRSGRNTPFSASPVLVSEAHTITGARNLTLVLMHGQQERTEWITFYATTYSFSYPLLIWDFIEIFLYH